MKGPAAHEAANLFPMLPPAELDALAANIKANGLREPIKLFAGLVLDGRNRQRACEIAGVSPSYVDVVGVNPWQYVWDLNAERRHLEPFQKAALAVKFAAQSEGWQEEQRQRKDGANRARSEAAKSQPREGNRLAAKPSGAGSTDPRPERPRQADEIAAQAKVAPATVKRALELQRKAPEQFEAVCRGEVQGRKALAEVKLQEKRALADEIRREPEPPPAGPFRVIALDPPWRYGSRVEDHTHRGRNQYPDMSTEEICALPVASLAHPDGCVLWLWTTNAFMRDAYKCLDAWGFQEKTILTWDKEHFGLGDWLRNVTEHCILAVCGTPVVSLTNQTTLIREARREHSRKPDAFYALVEALCPGSKLEMFAREQRTGWAAWGAESTKFSEGAG